MRDVIHRMGRRCRNWDYCGKGAYQITITLADRRSCALGCLRSAEGRGAFVELGQGLVGHFAAIGNHHLLKASSVLQVQCSRRFFAYMRDAQGRILKDKPPRVDACILNCLAQMIAGPGAAEIVYKGIEPRQVDELARAVVVRS